MSTGPASFTAVVLRHRQIAQHIYEMWLSPHPAMVAARPGQFVHIAVSDTHDPLLRRPISICQVNSTGEWSIVYRQQGRGTNLLTKMTPGMQISILGPLGNGYTWPTTPNGTALLVGGGVGVPPLLFLAQRLKETGWEVKIALGFLNKESTILVDEFCSLGLHVSLATQDGSLGQPGLVLDLLTNTDAVAVYSCGPLPMLQAVAGWCRQKKLPCQVSLEARMACGVGACLGCVCQVQHPNNPTPSQERVCREGPVFNAEVVFAHAK